MKIGVDSSVIIAGVHANHPSHAVAADWLVRNLAMNRLIVTHHSVLESYAVLTRLPGDLRGTPSEARDLLRETVQVNMEIAAFQAESIWAFVDALVMSSAAGGRSYDVFALHILKAAGADALATFNPDHFTGLIEGIRIIGPSKPGS